MGWYKITILCFCDSDGGINIFYIFLIHFHIVFQVIGLPIVLKRNKLLYGSISWRILDHRPVTIFFIKCCQHFLKTIVILNWLLYILYFCVRFLSVGRYFRKRFILGLGIPCRNAKNEYAISWISYHLFFRLIEHLITHCAPWLQRGYLNLLLMSSNFYRHIQLKIKRI